MLESFFSTKMVSQSIIFLTLSVIVAVHSLPANERKSPYLQNYVLMPIQFADQILDKDIEKVEKVRKLSYALLKDLQENREKYPSRVVSRTFARVVEEGADALGSSLRDIHTLIYPNRVL